MRLLLERSEVDVFSAFRLTNKRKPLRHVIRDEGIPRTHVSMFRPKDF